jgi:probable HAF family extracellular repeat protein
MTALGDVPGGQFFSLALETSLDGSVIVGQGSSAVSDSAAVRWQNGLIEDLGAMVPNGLSTAWGVSADGTVIVGEADSPDGHVAFRWTSSGGMTPLGFLPGLPDGTSNPQSIGYAVSPNGSTIVGASTSAFGWQAFHWANGIMSGLGFVGDGFYSEARDVSADGTVIVGASNTTPTGGTQAFRWENGAMIGLGGIPGEPVGSYAQGVSADGQIVIGSAATLAPGGAKAFIWDPSTGMRSVQDVLVNELGLDLTGWFLSEVEDVSADGQTLVGFGINPQGVSEGWIAHLPEPATALLLLAVALLPRRRRPCPSSL